MCSRDHKLDSVSMAIGIRSVLNMIGQEGCTSRVSVMILNNRHNFKVCLLSDRLG